MPRFAAFAAALCLAIATFPMAVAVHSATAGSIYDSDVENKLNLTAAQRAKVRAIMSQGDEEFQAILRKYKIDPNARPVFAKLQEASSDLIAHKRRQRARFAQVLTPEQLKQYDKIIEATGARVRKAAQ